MTTRAPSFASIHRRALLAGLAGTVLAAAQGHAQQASVSRPAIPLTLRARSVRRALQPGASDSEIWALEPETAGPLRFRRGDTVALKRILTNLIENARSFVPEEGGLIAVRLRRDDGNCIVQIEDNGPGIEAETIDRIFERFYTDRPSSEDFGQNSGLGLSISRQIAEAHGGSLDAENVLGPDGERKGARFTLVLPEKGQS